MLLSSLTSTHYKLLQAEAYLTHCGSSDIWHKVCIEYIEEQGRLKMYIHKKTTLHDIISLKSVISLLLIIKYYQILLQEYLAVCGDIFVTTRIELFSPSRQKPKILTQIL